MQMASDSVLTWAVGAGCAVLSAALSGAVRALMGRGEFLSLASAAIKSNFGLASDAGLRSAVGLFTDVPGYFAANGRVFVNGRRFMGAALVNAWKNAPVEQTTGVIGTAVGTFGAGTPTGYAPEHAPVGGWAPDTLASQVNAVIDRLFR